MFRERIRNPQALDKRGFVKKKDRWFIQEICLIEECIQKDHWKTFLLEEKNNESFHFRTLLCGCLKDVATWLQDYIFMSIPTLRNLTRKTFLEALMVPKQELL